MIKILRTVRQPIGQACTRKYSIYNSYKYKSIQEPYLNSPLVPGYVLNSTSRIKQIGINEIGKRKINFLTDFTIAYVFWAGRDVAFLVKYETNSKIAGFVGSVLFGGSCYFGYRGSVDLHNFFEENSSKDSSADKKDAIKKP